MMEKHICDEMRKEIVSRMNSITIEGNYLEMVSTDDTYISSIAQIKYCPWCGVKLE